MRTCVHEYSGYGKKKKKMTLFLNVSGIGRDLCLAIAKNSPTATVIALAKTQAYLDTLKEECSNIETVCVDLGDWEATKVAVEKVLPVDGLVNNAGIGGTASVLETTPEMIDS